MCDQFECATTTTNCITNPSPSPPPFVRKILNTIQQIWIHISQDLLRKRRIASAWVWTPRVCEFQFHQSSNVGMPNTHSQYNFHSWSYQIRCFPWKLGKGKSSLRLKYKLHEQFFHRNVKSTSIITTTNCNKETSTLLREISGQFQSPTLYL